MRLFKINDIVWYTGDVPPEMPNCQNGAHGKVLYPRQTTGHYQVDFGGAVYACHENNLCLVNNLPQANSQQTVTDLANIEIANLVQFTQSIITFDNSELINQAQQTAAKYANLVITEADLPEMKTIRADLNKIIKGLEDSRKSVKSKYNEPLSEFEAKIKDVTSILSDAVAKIDNQTAVFEENRKAEKKIAVLQILEDMLRESDLPNEYKAKVVFREEYYNVTMRGSKLANSIQEQIDVQVQLYQAVKNEQELKQQRIKNRELLIKNLNQQYGLNAVYSQFTVEQYSDEQVENAFVKERARLDVEEAKKQSATAPKTVATNVQESTELDSRDMASTINRDAPDSSEVLDTASTQETRQATQKDASNTDGLTKAFNVCINTGNPDADQAAMNKLQEFMLERLNEMQKNFADKYQITMLYTVE